MSDDLWSFWRVDGWTQEAHWHESRSQRKGNSADRDGTETRPLLRTETKDPVLVFLRQIERPARQRSVRVMNAFDPLSIDAVYN